MLSHLETACFYFYIRYFSKFWALLHHWASSSFPVPVPVTANEWPVMNVGCLQIEELLDPLENIHFLELDKCNSSNSIKTITKIRNNAGSEEMAHHHPAETVL